MSAAAWEERPSMEAILMAKKLHCWLCGNLCQSWSKYSINQVTCHKCFKTGHFAKLCYPFYVYHWCPIFSRTYSAEVQTSKIEGYCVADFDLLGYEYRNINLNVINDLCNDVIFGTYFQEQHESVSIKYDGSKLTIMLLCSHNV